VTDHTSGLLADWYPGLAYCPGPTLARFIASPDRRILARAASQVGKTQAGAAKMDAWCLVHHDTVFGVLVADLQNHYGEVCAKIAQVITEPELDPATHYADGRGYYVHGKPGIRYRNGTRVLFRSGTGPVQGLESFSAGAAWIDEVPQKTHYNAFMRGIHGPVWVTFTPIGRDPAWFRRRVEGDLATGEPPEERWTQFVAPLSQAECPWRTPEQVAEMVAKTDPFERAQRIRAEWEGPTEDRRFTALRADSVTTEDLGVDAWATWGIDHGEVAGREFGVLLRWDQKSVVVSDEYVNPVATKPAQDAQGIVAAMQRRGVPLPRVRRWLGDANSAGKGNVGESVNAMLGRAISSCLGAGPTSVAVVVPRKEAGSVELGEQIINIALDSGELRIHERCVHLLRCLRHYQALGPRDPEKHGIDALRYALVDVLCHSGRPSTRLYAAGAPVLSFGGYT